RRICFARMIEQTGANPAALNRENTGKRLAKRAATLASIRLYFSQQQVLEVETPLLGQYPVTDPQLDNLRVENPFAIPQADADYLYLATSPEYSMKQLLSLGSGSIYQISKAFRQDTPGRLHAMEFTMLEWYRIDYDMDALIDDVAALIHSLIPDVAVEKISYRDAFIRYAGVDPFTASSDELELIARQKMDVSFTHQHKDVWLDLLLTHCVEKNLGQEGMTFLFDYPESQSALARLAVNADGQKVAKRFELYINGIELANGYHELTDADEQMRRFESDNQQRLQAGEPARDIDAGLMAAMNRGLPNCAGVALGVDRLLLLL
ncbi:MAG: EF-P lysine aminoacylase EpmA, partial [Pseudomonadales bacterium]|nr:EF-P lysine aminoacylase EpmA [Pseudomonadales bacterium]